MRMLVSGATGFLGQKLALRLHALGYEVIAVGRNVEIGRTLSRQGINFIELDLRDTKKIAQHCNEIECVFHCAALSSPWGKYSDFYSCNVEATRLLLQASKGPTLKRFIHVSTPSIYFDFTDRYLIKENDPLPRKPCNIYAETKMMAEREVDKAFKEGVPTITIRPRGIFGPGDAAIFPRILRAHSKDGIPLIKGGNAIVDITFVENVVDAMLLCMQSPESTLGKKYNITNGAPYSFNDIISMLGNALGVRLKTKNVPYSLAYSVAWLMEWTANVATHREPLFTPYSIGVISKSQTLDISRAQTELGYVPKVTIEEGIQRFARWWKENNV